MKEEESDITNVIKMAFSHTYANLCPLKLESAKYDKRSFNGS